MGTSRDSTSRTTNGGVNALKPGDVRRRPWAHATLFLFGAWGPGGDVLLQGGAAKTTGQRVGPECRPSDAPYILGFKDFDYY